MDFTVSVFTMNEKAHINLETKFKKVKEDFPNLKQKIYGKDLIYLDNAASAQKPNCVIETLKESLSSNYANIHRGLHFLSSSATEAYENSRDIVKNFLNAKESSEIIFTKNATEAINCVAYGWGLAHLKKDDEIILSVFEHHSNLIPWYFLKKQIGIKINFVEPNEEGYFSIENFQKLLTNRTKLVSITHMSNLTGTVLPVQEIISQTKAHGAKILIDGSQAILHEKIDVQTLNCDWYVFTGHKIYGPTGIGILYGKIDSLNEMNPFQGGGGIVESLTREQISFLPSPYRFEAGTPPFVEAIGLGCALRYLDKINQEDIFSYEDFLTRYMRDSLSSVKKLKIANDTKYNKNIFSFYFDEIHAYDLATFLDQQGIAVRSGVHCAQPFVDFLKLPSLCRASLAMYNTKEDIDALIESLLKATKFFKIPL